MSGRTVGIILLSAAITFSLRALPFLVFNGKRSMPKRLHRLGDRLPAAIMAVLIVYCLQDVSGGFSESGIYQLLAAAVVIGSYKWKHQTFLSIVLGTGVYMLLLHLC